MRTEMDLDGVNQEHWPTFTPTGGRDGLGCNLVPLCRCVLTAKHFSLEIPFGITIVETVTFYTLRQVFPYLKKSFRTVTRVSGLTRVLVRS